MPVPVPNVMVAEGHGSARAPGLNNPQLFGHMILLRAIRLGNCGPGNGKGHGLKP